MLSTIEKQRKLKRETQPGEQDLAQQDMSGELQTIPARHGVATFVPRGRTIKIINTYGKQVISTWAFGLAAPPEDGDDDEEVPVDEDEIEEKTKELKEEIVKVEGAEREDEKSKGDADKSAKTGDSSKEKEQSTDQTDDPPEQAPDTPENEKSTETTEQRKQPEKRTWSSYLPSIPYRSRGAQGKETQKIESNIDPKTEKAQNEAASKKWSSYLPTGKSFSSYVPNVQLPDSQGVMSAFKASHYRDPNKSYAEQLYDFSKTPVGAGTIAGMQSL